MKVLIMRHGEAEMFAAPGMDMTDANRPLTKEGIKDSHKVASKLVKEESEHSSKKQIDLVLISPYLRAQQTWESIKYLFNATQIQSCDDITPYGQAKDVVEYVCALAESQSLDSILLISHLPLVSYLTAEFVTEISPPSFNTSNIASIEFDLESRKGQLLDLYKWR